MGKDVKWLIEENVDCIDITVYNNNYTVRTRVARADLESIKMLPNGVILDLLNIDIDEIAKLQREKHVKRCKAISDLIYTPHVDAECGEPLIFDDDLVNDILPGKTAKQVWKDLKLYKTTIWQLEELEKYYNNPAKVRKMGGL